MVKKLVEYGADITVTDHNDRSVIAYAIERQEQVIFDYLYGLGKFDAVALYDHAIKVNNVPVMTYLKSRLIYIIIPIVSYILPYAITRLK